MPFKKCLCSFSNLGWGWQRCSHLFSHNASKTGQTERSSRDFSRSLIKLKFNCYVLYHTQENMFYRISKHQEESGKYNTQQRNFDELWVVWRFGKTVCRVFDNIFTTKTKLTRKWGNKIVKRSDIKTPSQGKLNSMNHY